MAAHSAAEHHGNDSGRESALRIRDCARGDHHYADFARAAPDATVYHQPEWLNAVEDAFELPCYRFLAERGRHPVGILPLAHVRSALFGNFLVSVPFGNYGGVVTADPDAGRALLAAGVELATSLGCRWIELRHIEPRSTDMPTHTRKLVQYLPLQRDPDAVWNGLMSKVRNHVRKAEKTGLECTIGGRELLEDFYGVFARNMRDPGTPPYARRFFERLFDQMGDALRVLTVRGGPIVMAGMIMMTFRKTAESPWASSLREFNSLCPNNLLYWAAIRDACERGFDVFDFGTSEAGSGVYVFKKQWKALERPLHRQYWLAPGQALPYLNPSNPAFAWKIRMWQKLPVWVTTLIGPPLARKLP